MRACSQAKFCSPYRDLKPLKIKRAKSCTFVPCQAFTLIWRFIYPTHNLAFLYFIKKMTRNEQLSLQGRMGR